VELNRRGLVERNRKKLLIFFVAVAIYALLGFFLAPYLAKKTAIQAVHDLYAAELRIEKISVNPFVLSIRVDGIEMDDPDGSRFASLDQLFVNFQLSSLFRRAFTFQEIRIDSPEVFVERRAIGDTNFAFLLASEAEDDEPAPAESSIPRLIVKDFSLNAAALNWDDAVPTEAVSTTFGPVDVRILDLSTLPQGEGRQEVVITTESTGTFSWSGSLQLNPLRSVGHASIDGSHFPLLSAYLKDTLGFEAVEGDADVGLDYSIDTLEDGELDIDVDNFSLAFNDVRLRTHGRVNAGGDGVDRDVLRIPSLRVDGGSLRMPEREVSIGSVSLDSIELELYRSQDGDLNIAADDEDSDADSNEDAREADQMGDPWSLSLNRVDIAGAAVFLIDDSVSPQANLGVKDLHISLQEISNESGARFPTDVSLSTLGGGVVAISGEVGALPAPSADLDLSIDGIALAFLHPYIKSLADVNLDSGAIGVEAKMVVSTEEKLSLTGEVAISNFLITETDEGSRLGSWDALTADGFAYSMSGESLDISEIRFDRPYGDILIAEDGSFNLGRVAPGRQTDAGDADSSESVQAEQSVEDQSLPLAVTIGRVLINDGAADFEDRSLPLPFDVNISELSGALTTIATQSTEPSVAELEGKVDEFGLVRVTGVVTPLQIALDTDLHVDFQNVEMPKFSAYSVPFAGREIASGKLDLFLGYKVENSQLTGENKIVLRDFELGDKVDHPGASSLPLGLAVALLKSPDGTIDIDLPVRGNVDDPDFRYGSVVGKALVNLVVKIATSPFALLGKLVGAEADELEFIAFLDGRADLTPPEQEKAAKLAEALALRPELKMEIYGVVDRENDGLAIRSSRLDESVDQQIEATSDSDSEQYAEQRLKVLEEMFGRKDVRDQMKLEFTTDEVLDDLAYATELRRQLIDAVVLDEADFISLAQRRASNVQAAILAADENLLPQISVGELRAIDKGEDQDIQMKVILTAGEADG
jgi:uncharacterized protein involved in outer membrane biogenesis